MPQAKRAKPRELASEFVVGGGHFRGAVNNASPDAVEQRLNPAFIDKLRLDAEVDADVSYLFDSVLSDGIEVVSRITDEDDPEFSEAGEIAEFVKKATVTQRPLELIVKEMGESAFYYGVKVGEIVLKYRNDMQIDGKWVLDRVNPKPNAATAFVTDKFYNVIGLVGAKQPYQPVAVATNVEQADIIEREKFLVIAFKLQDNDPRGVALSRSLVEEFCEKRKTRSDWAEWRRTYAIPKKVGITPDGAKAIAVKDSSGTPVLENGVPKTISAEKGLMNALEGFANNSAITAPSGTDIKQLEVRGTGEQFIKPMQYNDAKMRKVILGDSLVTGEADKDARAARESSKDVSDIRKQAFRTILANAVETDVFRLLTVVNFGEDKAHLTPQCFLGDTEANDWATDLQAASSAGYEFAPQHLRQLDAQFGVDPRDKEESVERQPKEPKPPTSEVKESDE